MLKRIVLFLLEALALALMVGAFVWLMDYTGVTGVFLSVLDFIFDNILG